MSSPVGQVLTPLPPPPPHDVVNSTSNDPPKIEKRRMAVLRAVGERQLYLSMGA
jgi:hypothetical protein